MKSFLSKKLFRAKGFTLVETMVAIFILTLTIAVAMGGIQRSLQSSNFARDQITGYYLAEEAVEYIRSVRDSNIKSGDSWLKNIEGTGKCLVNGATSGTCKIDSIADTITSCSGSSCDTKLNFNQPDTTKAGVYSYSGSQPTRFSRLVTITKASGATADDEITITAKVSWNTGTFGGQSYTITEQLYKISP